MLEGMEGDAPFIGEDWVAGGVDEHRLLAKHLPHIERAGHHVEPHPIYEHRRSSCITTTNSSSSYPCNNDQHRLIKKINITHKSSIFHIV